MLLMSDGSIPIYTGIERFVFQHRNQLQELSLLSQLLSYDRRYSITLTQCMYLCKYL